MHLLLQPEVMCSLRYAVQLIVTQQIVELLQLTNTSHNLSLTEKEFIHLNACEIVLVR